MDKEVLKNVDCPTEPCDEHTHDHGEQCKGCHEKCVCGHEICNEHDHNDCTHHLKHEREDCSTAPEHHSHHEHHNHPHSHHGHAHGHHHHGGSVKNMLIAFLLNLCFSIAEFVGGVFTGSIAIISDAIHDLGDAGSIGVALFLEKKSKKQPNSKYTYGYRRFSVLGSFITTLILLIGSVVVIYNAVLRIINPVTINYDGMLIFAGVGLVVNLVAALITHRGESLNQKAVSLHMLEDVLGWLVVLVGAVIMRFTDATIIDPIMSIGVALFILVSALKNMKTVLDIFLEKAPADVNFDKVKETLLSIDGVEDIHHIHLWTMNGIDHYATMHVVTDSDSHIVKENVRHALAEFGITHCTLELELPNEDCHGEQCTLPDTMEHHHHHH